MEYEKNWEEGQEPNPQERKFEPLSNNEDNETGNQEIKRTSEIEQDSGGADTNWNRRNANQDTDNPIVNPVEFNETNYNDADSNNTTSDPDDFRDYEDARITQSLTHQDPVEDVDYEDVTDIRNQDINPDDRYSVDYNESNENRNRIQNPNDFVDFENKDSKRLDAEMDDPDYRNTDGLNKLSNPDAEEISDGDYVDPIVNRNDDPYRTPGL